MFVHERRWDTRIDGQKPAYNIIAHEKAVNALAFNPHNEHVVATGSVDMVDAESLNIFVCHILAPSKPSYKKYSLFS